MAATDYNWPVTVSSVTATNPSVSSNGAAIATSSTLVAGSDGTLQRPVSTDTAGKLNINNISGTVSLPTGAATAAKQPALGTAGTASADVITVQGIASMTALKVDNTAVNGVAMLAGNGITGTGSQRVTVASDNTPFAVKIDQTTPGTTNLVALAANQSVNVAQMNGVATSMGNGVSGTGVQRVAIASDNTAFSVNATLQTGANVIGALTANQSINNAQINGVAPLMGNGVTGTGSQRVTIASDNTAFSVNAVQSGTWTFQPGNTANTTAWLVTQNGRTSANAPIRNDYSGTPVTTASYVQLVASTTSATSEIEIFDSSGQTLTLATGAAASEVAQINVFPGGNGRVPLKIAAGTRVSIKALSGSATTGEININFYA